MSEATIRTTICRILLEFEQVFSNLMYTQLGYKINRLIDQSLFLSSILLQNAEHAVQNAEHTEQRLLQNAEDAVQNAEDAEQKTIAEATIRPRADYLVHLNSCN